MSTYRELEHEEGDFSDKKLLTGWFSLTVGQLQYAAFMAVGIALLWPWNCFLSASDFFADRLQEHRWLSANYSSSMMTVSTLTSTLCNVFLSQKQSGVDYSKRLVMGQTITIVVFAFMGLLCVWNTGLNPIIFFVLVMINVALSSVAVSLSQVGAMAIVNVLGPIYANAVVVGNAVAGVLPSIALIISTALSGTHVAGKFQPKRDYAVMAYFLTACLVSGIALVLFGLAESHGPIDVVAAPVHTSSTADEAIEELGIPLEEEEYVPFSTLWAKLRFVALTIFTVFGVSLVFPVFASSIASANGINSRIFVPLAFLLWNLGDLAGRLLCAYPKFVTRSPIKLFIFSLARFLYIPLFALCNIHDRGGLIHSDVLYLLLQLSFGVSNGLIYSSAFMIVGDIACGENEQKAASGFTAVFLSLGLACGSLGSYLVVAFIL
ncbi:BA75_05004T0 [Komagataella pastoris]|uniref:BA75_05004T0 n=1 Tax=Komagataella pastoris TaxID=4922 RepID=A0A1B2JH61_PICPA|nr:BA75_05004T0 [Komagataella pastoris]